MRNWIFLGEPIWESVAARTGDDVLRLPRSCIKATRCWANQTTPRGLKCGGVYLRVACRKCNASIQRLLLAHVKKVEQELC